MKTYPQLTDDEAARVADELRALDLDPARPSDQARVHVAPDGALHLAVWEAPPVPDWARASNEGETWEGYLRLSSRLHPAAEAVAILRGPRSPEVEVERRRAHRQQCEAQRQAVKVEREQRDRQQLEADEERRRVFRTCGGQAWEALRPELAILYAAALGLEETGAESALAVAKILREVAATAERHRDGRLPFPGREWRYPPGHEPPRDLRVPQHTSWSSVQLAPPPPGPSPGPPPETVAERAAVKRLEYGEVARLGGDPERRDEIGRELLALEAEERRERHATA